MKRNLQRFSILLLVLMLISGTVLGAGFTRTIEVVYNTVNIAVNGQRVDAPNILYEGTTYVPLRAVSEALDKEVLWNDNTKTASINDKIEIEMSSTKIVKEFVGNSRTGKFHYSQCGYGPRSEDVKVFYINRDDAVKDGYEPCGHCNP